MKDQFLIELHERYIANLDELEELENLIGGNSSKYIKYRYRRVNMRLFDIEAIVEIPKNKDECVVRLYNGDNIVVKAQFDELSIRFNDLCNGTVEEGDIEINN